MSLLLLLCAASLAVARNNGVGKVPVMGYDAGESSLLERLIVYQILQTYNAFNCDYDGATTKAQAKVMNESGLVALGYNTFILDDCYTEINRSSTGELVQNLTRFPVGMKKWTQSINAYGVSGSAYSSNGYHTCAGYPGVWTRMKDHREEHTNELQGLRA